MKIRFCFAQSRYSLWKILIKISSVWCPLAAICLYFCFFKLMLDFKHWLKVRCSNTDLRKSCPRWPCPVLTNFLSLIKVSLEAKEKPWLVPYFGSERGSSEDEYVNVHMKTRHHRQSEFAGRVWKGEQESSVTLQFSYEVLPLAEKSVKAGSHLLPRWPSNWISLRNVSDTVNIILVAAKPLIHTALGLHFLLLGFSHRQCVSLKALVAFLLLFRSILV